MIIWDCLTYVLYINNNTYCNTYNTVFMYSVCNCIYIPCVFTIHGRMSIFLHFQDLWSTIHNRPTCVGSIPSTASRIMWRTWLLLGDRSLQRLAVIAPNMSSTAVGRAMDKLETLGLFFLLGKVMGKSSRWQSSGGLRDLGFIWERWSLSCWLRSQDCIWNLENSMFFPLGNLTFGISMINCIAWPLKDGSSWRYCFLMCLINQEIYT